MLELTSTFDFYVIPYSNTLLLFSKEIQENRFGVEEAQNMVDFLLVEKRRDIELIN